MGWGSTGIIRSWTPRRLRNIGPGCGSEWGTTRGSEWGVVRDGIGEQMKEKWKTARACCGLLVRHHHYSLHAFSPIDLHSLST